MYIGGFQKNSMIDFPGKIACVVFTQGCNFICPYCHNPDLVPGPKKAEDQLIPEEIVFDFLHKRKGMIDGVAITGGEPTLQRDLIDFCRRVKDLGYAIKMDTNGSCPETIRQLMDSGLIDYWAMDIKTAPEYYAQIAKGAFSVEKLEQSIALIKENADAYEFRTTCARPFVDAAIIKEIGELIRGADQYILQQCSKNVRVLNPQALSDDLFFSSEQIKGFEEIVAPFVKKVRVR